MKRQWSWPTFLIGFVVGVLFPPCLVMWYSVNYLSDAFGWGYWGSTNRAYKALAEGDYQRALVWANSVIRNEPEDDLGYALRGRAQELAGDYQKAAADYSVAIAYYDSPATDHRIERARVLIKLGLLSEAAVDYARYVVELHERNPRRFIDLLEQALRSDGLFPKSPVGTREDLVKFFEKLDQPARDIPVVAEAYRILVHNKEDG
ncbi:MAG: hypothetical protein HUU20_17570 [Pirellulales bacterium]|nr:hypothetical protein [Pirellulales bacterium]